MAGNQYIAPLTTEAEISIFGPGVGECIVIHLGDSDWVIVDSCLDWQSKSPVALAYLKGMGIDVSTAVKCFVITHWHNDHINGAAQIFKECKSADFVCSSALRHKEFLEFISAYRKVPIEDSGVEEFYSILEEFKKRRSESSTKSPKWAIADLPIPSLAKSGRSIRVTTLSPSHFALTKAFLEIGQLIPGPETSKRRAVAQKPNHVSVALWVSIDNLHVLLGSDLENHADETLGWKAVVSSSTRPSGRAKLIKIPHHGSENAYCKDVWDSMMEPDPIAVITPFSIGRKLLPAPGGLKKIKDHTSKIFCTGLPGRGHPAKLDKTILRTMKEMVKARRVVQGPTGHVRIRYSLTDYTAEPVIEMFEGADRL